MEALKQFDLPAYKIYQHVYGNTKVDSYTIAFAGKLDKVLKAIDFKGTEGPLGAVGSRRSRPSSALAQPAVRQGNTETRWGKSTNRSVTTLKTKDAQTYWKIMGRTRENNLAMKKS
jgi:hypothetical protein